MNNGPRIAVLDIETAPYESWTWGLWEENIGLEQIATEWSILSFSAKWLGSERVAHVNTGGRGPRKVRDDKALLKELWDILDQADIVVAQNGKAFDLKKINARMMMCGMLPYSPVRVVDTMLEAKRHFKFSSNKLAWLSKYLTTEKKSEHRLFPGFELWKECLKDNAKAWSEMRRYNSLDVLATEELYLKLRPWISGHPNVAVYTRADTAQCPRCGSASLQKRGSSCTQTGLFQRFQCNDCGGWSRARTQQSTATKRKSLLAS